MHLFLHISVIQPAVDEFNELNMKYEIERGCRNHAEDYATQVCVMVLDAFNIISKVAVWCSWLLIRFLTDS